MSLNPQGPFSLNVLKKMFNEMFMGKIKVKVKASINASFY